MDERENAMLKQKARVEWLAKGDSNSKFYHTRLRWRLLNNEIKGLLVNGEWCEEPQLVKEEVYKYFANRFTAQTKWGVNLYGVQFDSINEDDNNFLCSGFSEDKILGVVRECGGSKSPGSDGFNFNFIKSNWRILGGDIVKAIKWFFETGFIPRGCNASFVSLIPKCENPSKLGDFKPISLVGCIYKILAKILANRLKTVLEKVIDKNQICVS